MSWIALDWASKQKVGSSTEKLVLICLANFANDMNQCYPSHNTICEFAEVTPQTVIKSLHSLKVKNLITIEPRFQKTETGKNRQTSNLYKLKIPPYENYRGVGQENIVAPPLKKQTQTSNNKPNIKGSYTDEFNRWWDLYPRKDGSKRKAYELFNKLIQKEIEINDLISVTLKYKKLIQNQDTKFIPHATTWLNQRRFETVNTNENKSKNALVG